MELDKSAAIIEAILFTMGNAVEYIDECAG